MNMKKLALLGSLVLLVALSGSATAAYYFYTQYQKTQKLLQNPTEAAKVETQSLVSRVGKLIELPKEEVTVATVIDAIKLKEQPFFAQSQNGDKVLIYTQTRKAILYRPTANKVIEVA